MPCFVLLGLIGGNTPASPYIWYHCGFGFLGFVIVYADKIVLWCVPNIKDNFKGLLWIVLETVAIAASIGLFISAQHYHPKPTWSFPHPKFIWWWDPWVGLCFFCLQRILVWPLAKLFDFDK